MCVNRWRVNLRLRLLTLYQCVLNHSPYVKQVTSHPYKMTSMYNISHRDEKYLRISDDLSSNIKLLYIKYA